MSVPAAAAFFSASYSVLQSRSISVSVSVFCLHSVQMDLFLRMIRVQERGETCIQLIDLCRRQFIVL